MNEVQAVIHTLNEEDYQYPDENTSDEQNVALIKRRIVRRLLLKKGIQASVDEIDAIILNADFARYCKEYRTSHNTIQHNTTQENK